MSDYNSSLPVRTEANGDIVAKLCDGTTNTQILAIDTNEKIGISSIVGITSKGQATMENSFPVVLASDQSVLNVNVVGSTAAEPIHDFDQADAIGAGNPDTHTYTATGAFKLHRVFASASGKMKVDVWAGPAGTTLQKAVGFNSTSNPNVDMVFENEIPVASGHIVEVVRTNLDKASMNMYSYINGYNQPA